MHVLLLTHAFPPDQGGIESFSYALARGMACDHGIRVTVATWTRERLAEEDSECFRIVRRPNAKILFTLMREADVVLENSAFLSQALLQLAARRPRVRVLHGRQDMALENETRPSRRALAACVVTARAVWTRTASEIVAVSQNIAESMGFTDATVIHNGFASETFCRLTDPTTRDPHTLITVSRLTHEKAVDMAVRAIRQLHDRGVPARLTIVGDGPERPRLEELASRLGVTNAVEFLGPLEPYSVNKHLNTSSVFAIPSRYEEAFGIAILEAQAAGCAVVASERGGIPEAMDGYGVLFPSGDQDAFTDAIHRVMTEPTARAVIVAPTSVMRTRTNESMVAEYVRVLREVTSA
ncbi:glycosyltransferase family 4 protein [Micrococcus luteus]|uniref:glycosyltransferase family 4 protein n=1 Tax=Micrococcus luteus TaxID=1270 RepID=UPI003014679B